MRNEVLEILTSFWAAGEITVVIMSRETLTGPSNNQALLVACVGGLGDNVEVNVVDNLVRRSAVVLMSIYVLRPPAEDPRRGAEKRGRMYLENVVVLGALGLVSLSRGSSGTDARSPWRAYDK